ncbi:MAG: recombinase family protein [Ruminococcaceae bacterium]|nr:recombinase family protein [Oscillospiraceae bacterium]
MTSIYAFPNIRKIERKLRVCAYCRVSTDKDDQQNSFASQQRYFSEYIKQHGDWQFVGIYPDEGRSGTTTKKREHFNQMIEDCENGLIDLIITKEVSRFARNTVDTLAITRHLKKLGVYVIFVNDNINTGDNDGELRLSIMATIAQDESRKTSERVKWGQKRQMEKGVVFGRDMLGYAVRDGKLYLIEDEAEIVKKIFHKYTNEGKGTHVIARELKEEGCLPKSRVKEWSAHVILTILRNEKYVGDLCQKKTYTPDYLDHAKKYNRGAEEKVYIKDHHPEIAIIDRDLWNRTQAELERRTITKEMKSKHSNRYWCSGKLICGDCGSRFVSRTKHLKNGTTYKSWRCIQSARFGTVKYDPYGNKIGCEGKSIGDRTLRYMVAYTVNDIMAHKGEIIAETKQIVKALTAKAPKTVDKNKIERDIESLRKKKLRIIDLAAEGAISTADMKEQNEYYTAQIAELEAKAVEAERLTITQMTQAQRFEEYIKRIEKMTEVDLDDDEVLGILLDHAVVYTDNIVDLYLKCLPYGVRIKYKASGKMDFFKVEIESFEPIEEEQEQDAQYRD